MNLSQTFEENCQEVSRTAAAIVGRLAAPERLSGPALYNQVIRDVTGLERKWARHLQLLSELSVSIEPQALARIEMNARDIAEELGARSSAGWARTPELGVTTIRLKVADTLTSLLQLVEEERRCVPTLIQRAALNHVVPVRELAVA